MYRQLARLLALTPLAVQEKVIIPPFSERTEILYTMLNPEQRIWGSETSIGSLAELAWSRPTR